MGCISSTQQSLRDSLIRNTKLPPIQLANKSTIIPLNRNNGEYTSIYPEWLTKDISMDEYSKIIHKLNDLNKHSLVWNKKRMEQYRKLSKANSVKLIKHDQQQLNSDTDTLLFEMNEKILNPLRLNATYTCQTYEMGVIIQRIHSLSSLKCPRSEEKEGNFIVLRDYESYLLSTMEDDLYGIDDSETISA